MRMPRKRQGPSSPSARATASDRMPRVPSSSTLPSTSCSICQPTHRHTQAHSYTHTHTHTHTQAHTYTHTRTHHAGTQAHARARARSRTHTHSCEDVILCNHTHTRTEHARAHAPNHTSFIMHERARARALTFSYSIRSPPPPHTHTRCCLRVCAGIGPCTASASEPPPAPTPHSTRIAPAGAYGVRVRAATGPSRGEGARQGGERAVCTKSSRGGGGERAAKVSPRGTVRLSLALALTIYPLAPSRSRAHYLSARSLYRSPHSISPPHAGRGTSAL